MADLLSFVADWGYWAWLILGLILIALETVVPGVHFLWFGVAALVMGAIIVGLEAAGHGGILPLYLQFAIYAVIAIASAFWMRTIASMRKPGDDPNELNQGAAQYVGRLVIVEDDFDAGRGRVRLGDTVWAARGPDAKKGAQVRVVDADGTVLVVEAS